MKNFTMKRGLRTLGAAVPAVAFALASVPAQAVTISVDGDLTDLIAAQSLPLNSVTATDPFGDAGGQGFDITNVYSHYDAVSDTFYMGIKVQGTVGNACQPNSFIPGPSFCPESNDNFDSNENYRFLLDLDSNGSNEATLTLSGGGGTGIGPDITSNLFPASGVTFAWAAAESSTGTAGVEFSISGLDVLNGFSSRDFTVQLGAGSTQDAVGEDLVSLSGTVVPVPAAVWLFGSGLIGLLGVSRRRDRN